MSTMNLGFSETPGDPGRGAGLPISGGVLAALLAGAFLLLQAEPFHPSRPTGDPELLGFADGENVRARLWEDPFAVTARHRKQPGQQGARPLLSFERVREGSGRSGLTVLGVMVFGGPYAEQAERRLRSRHATLSALGVLGYEPMDSEHIGYFEPARPSGLVVPYEWYRKRDGDRDWVLLLWLDDDRFRPEPLAGLAAFFAEIEKEARPVDFELKLLGPFGSTNLRALADELDQGLADEDLCRTPGEAQQGAAPQRAALQRAALRNAEVYSPSATIANALLSGLGESSLDERFQCWTGSETSRFLRTIGTDQLLGEELVRELQRRGVDPVCSGSSVAECNQSKLAHVAIVSEWDTHYGRALPCAFTGGALGGRYPPSCRESSPDSADGEPRWIHRFSYLRGLDGQLPVKPEAGEKQEERAARSVSGDSESVERPLGQRRLDYLRRLASQLQRLDAGLRRDHRRGLEAIGVLGSDVYDKLLVLQALRKRFPHVIFFTTDLDASLLHPDEYRSARNLVVVSNFGLELHHRLQGNVPAFRDNYQTSLYFSTRLALDANGDAPLTQERIDAWMSPRVFEIGRSGAFDLSVERGAATSSADQSIHPPRADLLSRPLWVKKLFGGAAVLSVVFSLLYMRTYQVRVPRARAFFGLFLLAGTVALGLAASARPEGEPFVLFEGISVWPSLYLRFLVGLLSFYFLVSSWRSLIASDAELVRHHFLPPAGSPRIPTTWRSLWRFARRWLRPPWRFESRRRRPPVDDAAEPPRMAATELFRVYRRRGRLSRRLLRVLPLWILYFAIGRLVILITGEPNVPFRGWIADQASLVVTIFFAVSLLIFLILWVVDATKQSVWLTRALSDCRTKWPQATRDHFTEKLNLDRELIGEWLDIQAIAQHSKAVGRLVYFPVVVMILMIASRAPYFDNWDFPVGLCVVISVSLFYSIWCAVSLRRCAEHARSVAIDRYGTALISATGRQDDQSVDQIRLILDQIRSLQVGAFVPFRQQPWVRAVALLFGGGGSLVLLEYLVWLN